MCSNSNNLIERYAFQIEKCIGTKHLRLGKLLHSHLIKTALNLHTFLANRLIHMYAECGSIRCAQSAFDDIPHKNDHSWNTMLSVYSRAGLLHTARELFDEMPSPNLVSYNSMISSLTHHGYHREALQVFLGARMHCRDHCVVMDKFTVVGVASACASLAELKALRQVHGAVIVIGLELNLIMYNVLIDAYGKCGEADASRRLFDHMETRNVVSWTSLVAAYIHAHRVEEANWVFSMMPVRNAVSWTALIAGHSQNGQGEAALEIFERMMEEERITPTPFTFVSVLSACASLALIERGKQLHGYIARRYMGTDSFNIFIYNALIDMYAKCGDMNSATSLFDGMLDRDIVSWNSLVTGFAQNGHGKQSLMVFERMVAEAGIKPNHVTFLGVLSACSHSGLLSEGLQFLELMEKEYALRPRPEHYAAYIDALGRKHRLEEAIEFIERLPSVGGRLETSVGTWGALLGACRVHGDLDVAKRAADSLFALEPKNGARYVMLSNIYAAAGQWEDVRQVRVLMKGKGLSKQPACSWIEVRSAKHRFLAEEKSHHQTEEIYQMLTILAHQMKESGYHSQSCIHDEEGDVWF